MFKNTVYFFSKNMKRLFFRVGDGEEGILLKRKILMYYFLFCGKVVYFPIGENFAYLNKVKTSLSYSFMLLVFLIIY